MGNYWLDLDNAEKEHPLLFWSDMELKTHLANYSRSALAFKWDHAKAPGSSHQTKCWDLSLKIDAKLDQFKIRPDHEGYFIMTSQKVAVFLERYDDSFIPEMVSCDKALNNYSGLLTGANLTYRLYHSPSFRLFNHIILGTYDSSFEPLVLCAGKVDMP